jgi:hypothetical protein
MGGKCPDEELRMPRIFLLCLFLALACEETPAAGSDIETSRGTVQPVRPPPGWSGQGVLARSAARLPDAAPYWTHTAAEVVVRDGKRWLRTSGYASRIKDAELARATADARARAELARWLASADSPGGEIIGRWQDPDSGMAFTLMELEVGEDWVPGRPLE